MIDLMKNGIRRYKYQFGIVLFLQTFVIIISLIIPYLNGRFVDILIEATNFNDIIYFIELVVVMSIMGFIITYAYKVATSQINNRISYDLNIQVLRHLQRIHIEKFETFNPTYLNQRIKGDSENIVSFFIGNIASIFINLIAILFMLLLFLFVNKSLFIATIIFIPVYCLLYVYMKKPLYAKRLKSLEISNSFFGKMNDVYSRNREIKVKATSENELNDLNHEFKKYFKMIMNYLKLTFKFSATDEIVSLLFQIAVFIIGGSQVITKHMTIGEFTIMTTYFNIIIEKIKYYFELGQSYQSTKVSVDRINSLLSIEEEKNGSMILNNIENISLKNVNYQFGSNKLFLKNIEFEISRPGIYAFIGKNGSGKTTLMNMILGINKLSLSGKIYFNGIPTYEIDMYKLRKHSISAMMQNEKLPMMNVHEYIQTFFTEDKIAEIRKNKTYSNVFFSEKFNLVMLYEKELRNLSSGEKQMLQLFITYFKEADLYIFDEPTSNLHPILVKQISNLLYNLKTNGKYVFVITHESKQNIVYDKYFDMNQLIFINHS